MMEHLHRLSVTTVSQEKMVGSSSDMFDIKFSKFISSNQLNEWVDNETPSVMKW